MNYYILSNPFSKKYTRLIWDKKSPYYGRKEDYFFQNDQYIIDSPFPLFSENGKQFTDFLWPYGIKPRCISNRLLGIMESVQIKGYITYPVSIHTPGGQEIHGYTGIHIPGKRVNLDFTQSKIVERPLSPGSDRLTMVYVNISIYYSQVHNRDIFLAYGGIMISEKLQKILVDNAIQNVVITKLTDWELDELVVKYIPK